MMQNLKKIVNGLATFGPAGYFPFAGLIAVVLSTPIIMVMNTLIFAFPTLYPFLYVALTLVCAVILIFALQKSENEVIPRNAMMINRMLGLLIVFSGIAVNLKLLIIGSLFFLIIRHFLPHVLLKYADITFSSWPGLIHLLFIDMTTGLAVNVIFRFIFWLVAMPR